MHHVVPVAMWRASGYLCLPMSWLWGSEDVATIVDASSKSFAVCTSVVQIAIGKLKARLQFGINAGIHLSIDCEAQVGGVLVRVGMQWYL
jgi:hypothetical protein